MTWTEHLNWLLRRLGRSVVMTFLVLWPNVWERYALREVTTNQRWIVTRKVSTCDSRSTVIRPTLRSLSHTITLAMSIDHRVPSNWRWIVTRKVSTCDSKSTVTRPTLISLRHTITLAWSIDHRVTTAQHLHGWGEVWLPYLPVNPHTGPRSHELFTKQNRL